MKGVPEPVFTRQTCAESSGTTTMASRVTMPFNDVHHAPEVDAGVDVEDGEPVEAVVAAVHELGADEVLEPGHEDRSLRAPSGKLRTLRYRLLSVGVTNSAEMLWFEPESVKAASGAYDSLVVSSMEFAVPGRPQSTLMKPATPHIRRFILKKRSEAYHCCRAELEVPRRWRGR
ncbi:LOW QUALITY PROTEIN: hypothetical protein U9M48_044635 [Paspalum notatum var. saurae]|uniref:Uncharacterized protein n=1 Tax=Paspalum notatum var. saurae TaxID=547442 RepID=A0AAQ3UVG7_PASNO